MNPRVNPGNHAGIAHGERSSKRSNGAVFDLSSRRDRVDGGEARGDNAAPGPVATVLVADDEPVARRGLRRLLHGRSDLRVIGECDTGVAAVELIDQLRPDLVLLDVQMPGLGGLDVVRRIAPKSTPLVIFVTAYDEFAVEAFDLAAVDYVVKPFTDERLMRSLDRALARWAERSAAGSLHRLVDALAHELAPCGLPAPAAATLATDVRPSAPPYRERFLVTIGARNTVVGASQIAWIRANGYYATLVALDRKELLVRTPLDQLEKELDPAVFVRTHRSAIVRLTEVRGADRHARRKLVVVLRDGTRVPVSRSRREAVLRALGAVTGQRDAPRRGARRPLPDG